MFQFGRLALLAEQYTFSVLGCPIRKSSDIMLVCSSPKLIAAYHVLHRLSDPRHSPYTLICFKKIKICKRLASITIVYFTRKYNFYSQYVKELNQMQWCKWNADVKISNLQALCLHLKFEKNCEIVNWKFSIVNLFVEDIGVEPMTLCVQGRCSSQLS